MLKFLKISKPEPQEPKRKICKCEKPDILVRGYDSWQFFYCQKCEGYVFITDMLNNLFARIKRLEKE
jgi:hypothetical protein